MLKAAVIGVGNMGRHHARVYSELEDCELVAVADLNEKIGKELSSKYNCKYYSDYKEMINQEKIDVISIVLPNVLHREVAVYTIKKGINTLIEKPIADTIENAKRIIKEAKKHDVKVTVGHIERFNPVVIRVKDILKTGELGNVTSINVKRVGLFPPQIKDANVIIDLAVHDIDICSYLLEKRPSSVFALKGKGLIKKREDYAEILLKYNGTNAVIQANWITPIKVRNMAITGTKGYLEANYITQIITIYKSNYNTHFDDFGDYVVKFGEPEKVIIEVVKKEPLKEEIRSFIDSIQNNKEPEVKLSEALNALEIAIKANNC